MSDLVVHVIPGSPYVRSALATLEEKGATYRLAPVDPGKLKSPAYLAMHAFGRVPVLSMAISGSTRRRRSSAISIACCRTRRSPPPLRDMRRAWTRS